MCVTLSLCVAVKRMPCVMCCLCPHEAQWRHRLNNIPQHINKHLQNPLQSVSYKFHSNWQIYRPRMPHISTFGNVFSLFFVIVFDVFLPSQFRLIKMWNELVRGLWRSFRVFFSCLRYQRVHLFVFVLAISSLRKSKKNIFVCLTVKHTRMLMNKSNSKKIRWIYVPKSKQPSFKSTDPKCKRFYSSFWNQKFKNIKVL